MIDYLLNRSTSRDLTISEKVWDSISLLQGEIYELVTLKENSIADFSEKYLRSDFCNRHMDALYSRWQGEMPSECLDRVLEEFPLLPRGEYEMGPGAAHWMGYVYRQIVFQTGLPSKDIVETIPYDKMYLWFPAMHTLSYNMAVDKILESCRIQKAEKYRRMFAKREAEEAKIC